MTSIDVHDAQSWSFGDVAWRFAEKYGIYAVLLALVLAASFLSPVFLNEENLLNILRSVAFLGVVAVGMTLVVIAGGLVDLSVSAVVTLSVVATVATGSHGLVIAGLCGLGCGLAVGAINAVLIGGLGANSVIVTLGTLVITLGAAIAYTGGNIVYGDPSPALTWLGTGSLVHVPAPAIVFGLVALALSLLLRGTIFGRWVYATGAGYTASRASGIPVRRTLGTTFIVSGLCAGLAGVLLAGLLHDNNGNAGDNYEFSAIAAIAVGGTSLFGGSGSIARTVVGVLIIGVINNLLLLRGLGYAYQLIVTGVLIVLAVWLDLIARRRRGRA